MTSIASALKTTFPTAEFTISDNDPKTLDWHSTDILKPTNAQIDSAVANYETLLAAQKAEKEAVRQSVLSKLGLTAEEAAALLA